MEVRTDHVGKSIAMVQALRAAACLLVVAYHALDAPPRIADAIWPNGAAGVDLFFVISGFVMATSSAGLSGVAGARRFLARRLRRIVPLYWLMTGVKLAVLVAAGAATLPGVWQVAASLLFIPSRDGAGAVRPVLGVGWTLQFEMLFYLLFALAVTTRPRWRVASIWLLLPILAPLAVAGFWRRADWPAPLALANGLVLEFCLGLAVAAWCGVWGPVRRRWPAALMLAGTVLLLTLPPPGPWRFVLWGGPAALILAGAVWLERPLGQHLPRWLLTLGEASYAIYLLHPFIVPALAQCLHGLPDGLRLAMLLPASLGASIAGGVALHVGVDRPIQRCLAASRRRAPGTLSELVQT